MAKEFEEFQRVGGGFQNLGKGGFDAAVKSFGEVKKGFQAITAEVTNYSKRSSSGRKDTTNLCCSIFTLRFLRRSIWLCGSRTSPDPNSYAKPSNATCAIIKESSAPFLLASIRRA